MIELVAETVAAIAAAQATLVAARWRNRQQRRTRYASCLRSIDRLECEIFPELLPSPTSLDHKLLDHKLRMELGAFGLLESGAARAGAIWPAEVPPTNYRQVVPKAEWLDRSP